MSDLPSLQRRASICGKRDVEEVPFIELFGARLQGVVSSGSDPNRVYISWVAAGSLDYYCSTNNNRRCGGLGGSACKHIRQMVEEAAIQVGTERVARFLKLPDSPEHYAKTKGALVAALRGAEKSEPATAVFSRFLSYLRYCELAAPKQPAPEMAWFV